MRVLYVALVFLASLITGPTVQTNPIGTWRARFTGPIGERPKPFAEVIFRLRVTDSQITGTAIMGTWPGEAPLTYLKFDGDHFSATAIGTRGWSTRWGNQPPEDHCCPKALFDGTISGDDMSLTMALTSTEASLDEVANEKKLPLVAKRISDDPDATIP